MKNINLLFYFSIFYQLSFGQNRTEELSKALSYVSTGTSFTSLGNFTSFSTSENTLKGSLFFLNKKQSSIYTIDLSAGSADGISILFDKGKLNTKVSLGGEYRIILNSSSKKTLLGINLKNKDLLENEKRKIEDEYDDKLFKLIKLYKSGQTDFQSDKEMNKKIKTIDSIISLYNKMPINVQQNLSDSELGVWNRMKDLRKKLSQNIEKKIDEDWYNELNALYSYEKEQKLSEVQNKLNDIKPSNIRLNFLSFGYSATREDFKFLNDTLEFSQQITSKDYISHNLKFSYNFIANTDKVKNDLNRVFFSAGFQFSLTNNLSSLTKVEVIDSKVIDSISGRTSNTKQNAFEGSYKEDINNLNLFIDYFQYLSKGSNSIAIHMSPRVLISDFLKPVTSFQFGFLLPFKNKEKQSTIVNLELFYKITDIFNTTENKNALLNRNQIGFQTSFPFNF